MLPSFRWLRKKVGKLGTCTEGGIIENRVIKRHLIWGAALNSTLGQPSGLISSANFNFVRCRPQSVIRPSITRRQVRIDDFFIKSTLMSRKRIFFHFPKLRASSTIGFRGPFVRVQLKLTLGASAGASNLFALRVFIYIAPRVFLSSSREYCAFPVYPHFHTRRRFSLDIFARCLHASEKKAVKICGMMRQRQ